MMITLGANLYVVSKLLGHSKVRANERRGNLFAFPSAAVARRRVNLKTTEIYAKIVNKKKDDAIALIDKEFADTH